MLKLSDAPQMAFVRAKDMFGDRVKATESFRLGESLGSAGKALWARQTLRSRHFSTLNLNSGPKQNRWIRAKGRHTSQHTHTHIQSEIKASEHPPKLRLSGSSHPMSHKTKELVEQMEGNVLRLHFQLLSHCFLVAENCTDQITARFHCFTFDLGFITHC